MRLHECHVGMPIVITSESARAVEEELVGMRGVVTQITPRTNEDKSIVYIRLDDPNHRYHKPTMGNPLTLWVKGIERAIHDNEDALSLLKKI